MVKISEAELEVMKIVWEKDEITSSEIVDKLQNKNWTDNTIRTLINRLVNKKAIGISRKERNRIYIYVPLIKEEKYKNYVSKKLLKKLFNNSIEEMIECLKYNDED